MDITDSATRSRMMSGIRSKDTKPELLVRQVLHRIGLRFRLHVKELPGSPDLVFPRFKTVIFVHGCFWHQHDCSAFKMPSSRHEFWTEKLNKNRARDLAQVNNLLGKGWRVGIVWECSIKAAAKSADNIFFQRIADWLRDESSATAVF